MTLSHKIEKNTKICILHLLGGLQMGGAEIMVVQYIKSLGTKDYNHFVYCFGVDGPVREKIEALGIPVHMGKLRAPINQPIRFVVTILLLIKDLLAFIRKNRIQIIQSQLSRANKLAVVVGKLARLPAFPTIQNTMEFVDRRSRWNLRVHINQAVDWLIFPIADRIVAVSQEVKEIVHQRFRIKRSKIIVLNNGIVFDESRSELVNIEKEFLIPKNTLKIISIGRLSYQKAMEVLISATAELVASGMCNIFVMIVGEGEDRKHLEKLILELGLCNCVKLLGIRHNVIELMKASDIFVMPSRFEGLSVAMTEAMACGLPIIASDAPGLKTFIIHGQNGLLFPVENHEALAERIFKLANDRDLREKLSYGAKHSFEREYDMRRNITPFAVLIQSMVSVHKAQKNASSCH
jgi:glycosyltransferase involved in cell wall biosynthesis